MIHYHPKFEDLHHYCMPMLAPRDVSKEARGYEIVGTGTLIRLQGRQFVVTASHVADQADDPRFLLYPRDTESAAGFNSLRLRTNPELEQHGSPANNVDIGAFEVESGEVYPDYRFLGEGQLLPHVPISGGKHCVATGYPAGHNRTIANSKDVQPKLIAWHFETVPLHRYVSLGLDPVLHVALQHDRFMTRNDGKCVKMSKLNLKGMSGGPMWISTGEGYALVAVVSDHLSAQRVVFGTRLKVLTDSIYAYVLRDS